MKSVLISIQPKWCELIASGKKTIEVRKTKPKIDVPFKAYIYETQALYKGSGGCLFNGRGKVIGEFVCDNICEYMPYKWREGGFEGLNYMYNPTLCYESRLSQSEVARYANRGKVYGWHISDLLIYDEPKELSEFYTVCKMNCEYCKMWGSVRVNAEEFDMDCKSDWFNHKPLKRPPQSWCYVEAQ